ncbi:hypothetical protein FDP25_07110 [Roseovarius sp. A21]|uniref:Haem-binding uptake Tiki superfamily ChaN domain-containing protein n=1 Tax=Roseovarius bejariae TaxID=2576383 RepID=A0A844CKF1_9RHOB|nr:ChaN family lipoprotein [Roseovarius bejariae]MRU15197.1 hypothetical protein [Roseovarius bejariae]
MSRVFIFWVAMVCASPLAAQDILVIGEIHDNPAHHETQAELVQSFSPKALVFEMLTSEQAGQVTPSVRNDMKALADAVSWADSGWPDFAMYYPIFEAAPEARIYGAQVPRDVARAAFEKGVAESFLGDAIRFGLTEPLPEAEQDQREAMQMVAHCDALPDHLVPAMVDIQRLRDAEIARVAIQAMQDTGGPVAVITGNGHARRDWGMPVYLQRAAPDLELRVIGQAEDGSELRGIFDEVISAHPVDRPDPCAAFQ